PPKKDNPAKDAICHECGEIGHWRRNCPVHLAKLMKKKKLSQGASASALTASADVPSGVTETTDTTSTLQPPPPPLRKPTGHRDS
ncbi:zinc finger, CCHC-type containing protein, partial [Tanacetum coccineum]